MTIMQKVYWLIASMGNIFALYFISQNASILSSLLLLGTIAYTVVGFYDLNFSRHNLIIIFTMLLSKIEIYIL